MRVLLAVALVALVGCSSGPERPSPTKLVSLDTRVDMQARWSTTLKADDADATRLVADQAGGVVYAAAGDAVKAIDATTGKVSWALDLDTAVSAGISEAYGNLYWVDVAGYLHSAGIDGERGFRVATGREVLVPPSVSTDRILVQGSDGSLATYAYDGMLLWQRDGDSPSLGFRGQARAATLQGGFLVARDSGDVMAVLADDGLDAWRRRLGNARDDLADLDADPAIAGELAMVAGAKTGVTALLVKNGQVYWESEVTSLKPLHSDGDNLYAVDLDGQVFALELRTGQVVWRQPALKFRYPSGPLATKAGVVVVDSLGVAHTLNTETGEIIGRTNTTLRGSISLSSLDDDVLAMDTQGRLVRIGLN